MNVISDLMVRRMARRIAAIACLVGLAAPAAPTRAQSGGIASPSGQTYSVTHRLGRDPVDLETEPQCFSPITVPGGAPDDIVTFDGVPEEIRTDIFGTTPTIDEVNAVTGSASYTLTIVSRAPVGRDLFPPGLRDTNGNALTHGCYTVGLDDTLDWVGVNNVVAATLTARKDGLTVVGPLDVTSSFSNPWDGFLNVVLDGVAGARINEVELQFLVTKDIGAPVNDLCADASFLAAGGTLFSNIGAGTDGPQEPLDCNFSGSDQIGSDIWYEHTAPCTGDLTIDSCDSGFDTKLAVYGGCGDCPIERRPIACNDDTDQCGPVAQGSSVGFPVTQGECFTVRLGGFLSDQGSGTIQISCRPGACCIEGSCLSNENKTSCGNAGGAWFPGQTCGTFACPPPPPDNDECADCITVFTGVPYEGTTAGATGDAGDSSCVATDDADVWHCWTADCDGLVDVGLCDSPFDTTLAVFDTCGGAEIACNDDACQIDDARIRLEVTAGTPYVFRVAGVGGTTGDYVLEVSDCSDPRGACCEPDGPFPCIPTEESTCLEFNGTFLGENTVCLGDLNENGVDDACESCDEPEILSSGPLNCAIDARYPSPPDDAEVRFGWDRIELLLDCEPGAMTADDFAVTVEPAGPTAPTIDTVDVNGGTVVLGLSEPIPTKAWTCFEVIAGGARVCFGYLPGDINGDRAGAAVDVLDLIDHLNGIVNPPLLIWQCDVDRSGLCQASDILGVIDLFNGAGAFEPWVNETLPISCPTAP